MFSIMLLFSKECCPCQLSCIIMSLLGLQNVDLKHRIVSEYMTNKIIVLLVSGYYTSWVNAISAPMKYIPVSVPNSI